MPGALSDIPAGREPARSVADMTIVLTGGSGRIGTALRQQLAGKIGSLRNIDLTRPESTAAGETWIAADICDADAMTQAVTGADAIVHMAGYPNERTIEEILRVNVLGTHAVYEAARRAKIGRVVFGSSNHTTGFYPRTATITPDAAMRPDSFYGLSKCCGELLAGLYFERFGIRSLNIRIGNATMTPSDARSHAIWVSPRDLAQLVLIGLKHPDIDCTTVFGVSRTAQRWWDNSTAEALGYRPQDSPDDVAELSAPAPTQSPLSHIAEHFQGGRFCTLDHDGQLRNRRTI